MARLDFDESVGRTMEVLYRSRDILRRRRMVHEALAARPGERILDVGCGPGVYAAELLDQVGPDGFVVGVDASATMLSIAERRVPTTRISRSTRRMRRPCRCRTGTSTAQWLSSCSGTCRTSARR